MLSPLHRILSPAILYLRPQHSQVPHPLTQSHDTITIRIYALPLYSCQCSLKLEGTGFDFVRPAQRVMALRRKVALACRRPYRSVILESMSFHHRPA